MKPKKIKKIVHRCTMEFSHFKSFVNYLCARKKTFSIQSTGYTKTVTVGHRKFTFLDKDTTGFVFPCFAKIKSDVLKSNVHIDSIDRHAIDYFNVSEYMKRPDATDIIGADVWNVDIRSAYLTTLLNTGFITSDTFAYVQRASKVTRLKAVGMLATLKTVYTFNEGIVEDQPKIITNEDLRNVFFFCCYMVGDVMNKIAEHYGEDFLFFWVDGIYIRNTSNPERAIEILKEHNYDSKFELLKNCNFTNTGAAVNFSYWLEEESRRKCFSMPVCDKTKKVQFNNYLKGLLKDNFKVN